MKSLENTKCSRLEGRPALPAFVAAAFYYGLVSIVSHIPRHTLLELDIKIWDKLAHFSVYLILGGLLVIGFARWLHPKRRRWAIAIASLCTLGLGTLDELHQLFVEGRSSSIGDIIADVLGGTTGALVMAFAVTLICARRNSGQ